jgi:hypothetical protein
MNKTDKETQIKELERQCKLQTHLLTGQALQHLGLHY